VRRFIAAQAREGDVAGLARFEREARVLASLDHTCRHPKDPDASSDITEVPTWYRCEPLPFSILEGELAGRSDPVREG